MANKAPKNRQSPERKAEAAAKELEERAAFQLQRMREVRKHTPAYTFKVGDVVMVNRYPMTVQEVYDDGMFYRVSFDFIEPASTHSREKHHKGEQHWHWYDLQPYVAPESMEARRKLSKFDETRLNFSQRQLDCLLLAYYTWNLDMSPEYQRGNVWTQQDKELLIESIFENRDIGKFVIVMHPFSKDRTAPHAEILDGKQRLSTLVEFFENRLTYKGLRFHDMHWRDQNHVSRYAISYAELGEKTTRAQKLQYFLKLNVSGVPQDPDHIKHVQQLLDLELKRTR
jgi:hypothetical protein